MSQSELQQVRASIRQYENLLEGYKIQVSEVYSTYSMNIVNVHIKSLNPVFLSAQVGKTRAEADEYAARLAQAEREAQAVHARLEHEIEEVRREMLGRLAELEPLPEDLRQSELQLQEAQDRECSQERRSVELTTALADLRMKVLTVLCLYDSSIRITEQGEVKSSACVISCQVETQGSQMELFRHKNKVLLEENRQLQQRLESLERSVCCLLPLFEQWLSDTGSSN